MYNKYLSDMNHMPNLMDLPKSNYTNNKTFDLSERNNMSDDSDSITLFSAGSDLF